MRKGFLIFLTSLLWFPALNSAADDPTLDDLIAKNQKATEAARCLDVPKRDLLFQWTQSYRLALQSQRCPVAAYDSDSFATPGVFEEDEALRQAAKLTKQVLNLEHCLNAGQKLEYYDWRREQVDRPASDRECAQTKKPSPPIGNATTADGPVTVSPAVPSPRTVQAPTSNEVAVPNRSFPSEFAIDFKLALSGRSKSMGGSPALLDTELNLLGKEVFDDLHGSPVISSLGLPYQWNLTLVDNQVINASSTAGGQIYVDGGMARLLGKSSGLWAAVLSHEVSHTALRHQVRLYLQELNFAEQIQELRLRVAKGDTTASWALLGLQIAAPIALRKMSRDQEHQADIQGMMLMARAGYHPDYVFALHHLLRMRTGDQSKFGAFFSTHPRWQTRDQRSDRAYSDALAEFNHLWPDPKSSPGGRPPIVAFVGDPITHENKQTKTADITLPLYCRNADNPVTLVVLFSHDKAPVLAADGPFRNSNGSLEAQESVRCFERDDAAPAVIRIPATSVVGKDRKLKAEILVVNQAGDVIERSKSFDVHFPKP